MMSDNKHNPAPESGWPKSNGMTVPEGYFDSFAAKMMEQIPAEEPKVVELPRKTLWQSLRPYVYMAAMFAGIWLMMNMFSLFTPAGTEQPAAQQPLFAGLVDNGTVSYVDDYVSSMSDYDLYDELYDSGFDLPDNI